MRNRFKRHMIVRNRLFDSFCRGLDEQGNLLLKIESMLIGYSSSFAFGSNYYTFFTKEVKRQLFQIIFNEHLLEFLGKRVDSILAHQNSSMGVVGSLGTVNLQANLNESKKSEDEPGRPSFQNFNSGGDGKDTFTNLSAKNSGNLASPPSSSKPSPVRHSVLKKKNTISNFMSYQNLSEFLFRKEHVVNLQLLPSSHRLFSISNFKKIKESLKSKILYKVVMRAQQLMEDDTLQKVKVKAEQQLKELGNLSPHADSRTPRRGTKLGIKISSKKRVVKFTRAPTQQFTSEQLQDKESLEARIFEMTKYNRLVRIFVKVVTDKDRLFHLECSEEYLCCLIMAYFESLNMNLLPHEFIESLN